MPTELQQFFWISRVREAQGWAGTASTRIVHSARSTYKSDCGPAAAGRAAIWQVRHPARRETHLNAITTDKAFGVANSAEMIARISRAARQLGFALHSFPQV
jgi:hypothetical protein